jgi:CTP:molybdopterin cytidylyltransferase MocA
MLTAIILAAGNSSRMGRPKALLEYRGKFFIENVCAALCLAGIEERVAVLGRDAAAITAAWKPAGEKVVVNPEPDLGQLSSLRTGMAAADPGAEGFMVCLADQPTIAPQTYKDIIAFWMLRKDSIIIPRCRREATQSQEQSQVTTNSPLATGHSPLSSKRGHPIIIPAVYRHLCFEGPLARGLRWVIHHPSVKIFDLTVEDAGIIRDFDTPQDYEKIRNIEYRIAELLPPGKTKLNYVK